MSLAGWQGGRVAMGWCPMSLRYREKANRAELLIVTRIKLRSSRQGLGLGFEIAQPWLLKDQLLNDVGPGWMRTSLG